VPGKPVKVVEPGAAPMQDAPKGESKGDAKKKSSSGDGLRLKPALALG